MSELPIIPPLRQSTASIMSCPKFYSESVIKGRRQPGGMESARGKDVHRVLGQYASYCASRGIAQHLSAFDNIARGVGPQAHRILAGLRESYSVDHAHLFGTEITMALDAEFQPTNVSLMFGGTCPDSEMPVCHEGTLDTLYLFRDERRANVDDAKTHPKPFNPDDTLQGKMYSLFCFQHFEWLEEVRFRLIFVRYKNLFREVIYRRSDVPMLIDVVGAARARQQVLHEDYRENRDMEAIPGAQCVYCPLLANRACPISDFNPQMQMSATDRLKFAIWYAAFNRVNNGVLKDLVQGSGRRVVLKDYNGKSYTYGPEDKEATVYPLFQATENGIATDAEGNPMMPIVSLLMDYANVPENADDRAWLSKLLISSSKLEAYLKASKRSFLHQAVEDTAEKITKVRMKISKPVDAADLPEDAEFEEDEYEEEEF